MKQNSTPWWTTVAHNYVKVAYKGWKPKKKELVEYKYWTPEAWKKQKQWEREHGIGK